MILIASNPEDRDAFSVLEALRRKGASAAIIHSSDFPTHLRKSVHVQGDSILHLLREREFSIMHGSEIDTVWWRRPVPPVLPEWIHPHDKEFAHLECREFLHIFWRSLGSSGAFWVNKPEAGVAAENKLTQQEVALACGLTIPETLYTNDPYDIRRFIREKGGQAIYKPFRQEYLNWASERTGRVHQLFTSIIKEADLPSDEVLAMTPGIFQEVVPKSYEIRLTIIGRKAFAARINSQETKHGRLDWRAAYHEISLKPMDVDQALLDRCFRLLDHFDLHIGCFDFIVTPEKTPVFLEVNQAGQFLWVECFTGLPLLDAFCELLIQRTKNFDWDLSSASIHMQDIGEAARLSQLQAGECHVLPPIRAIPSRL
jgi:glutathione synthase/RimK-type ligase-like ATP-grasp enzyme